MVAIKWDPTQFKLFIKLQMYQETDRSLAYLKGHTIRKLVSLIKYMSLLIRQDRPDAQKQNLLCFISGNILLKMAAHDMKSALVNDQLENHGYQKCLQDFGLADCQSIWGLAPKHTYLVGLRVGTNLELSW